MVYQNYKIPEKITVLHPVKFKSFEEEDINENSARLLSNEIKLYYFYFKTEKINEAVYYKIGSINIEDT